MRMTYEEFIKKNKDTLSIHYKEDHGDDPSEAELEEYVEETYGLTLIEHMVLQRLLLVYILVPFSAITIAENSALSFSSNFLLLSATSVS